MAFGHTGHNPALRRRIVRRQNLGEASVRGCRTETRSPRQAARAALPRRRGRGKLPRIASAVRPRNADRQSSAQHSALAVGADRRIGPLTLRAPRPRRFRPALPRHRAVRNVNLRGLGLPEVG